MSKRLARRVLFKHAPPVPEGSHLANLQISSDSRARVRTEQHSFVLACFYPSLFTIELAVAD